MRYVIDFDRTLFDTDSMTRVLDGRLPALVRGEAVFCAGELARFVYPDALQFLEHDLRKRIMVSVVAPTTSVPTNIAFQRAKIEASGILPFFDVVVVSDQCLKGPILARRFSLVEQRSLTFVDDMAEQICSVTTHCPRIRCIRIDRSLRSGNGGNVIASFAELPDLLRRTH